MIGKLSCSAFWRLFEDFISVFLSPSPRLQDMAFIYKISSLQEHIVRSASVHLVSGVNFKCVLDLLIYKVKPAYLSYAIFSPWQILYRTGRTSEQVLLLYYHCDSWKIFSLKFKSSKYTTPSRAFEYLATPIYGCAASFEKRFSGVHLPNSAVWSLCLSQVTIPI